MLTLTAACSGEGGADPTETPEDSSGGPAGTASCEAGAGSPDANRLQNPGFENGAEAWITLAESSGFEVTGDRFHSGAASARLRMRDPAQEPGTNGSKVYYLVQEAEGGDFPDVVCGYYFAENWLKGASHQYLQFVIIAFAPGNFDQTYQNYQIRYLLDGVDSPPFSIDNARFVFVTRNSQPTQGQWVPFELKVSEDFERLWGKAPEDFEKLRFLFEVRWDNKVAGASAAEADVYYDDLYAGPGG